MKKFELSPELRAKIEYECANDPETLDPKNSIKVVIIYEGFAPNADHAQVEMINIAQNYGMKICDVIIQPSK